MTQKPKPEPELTCQTHGSDTIVPGDQVSQQWLAGGRCGQIVETYCMGSRKPTDREKSGLCGCKEHANNPYPVRHEYCAQILR